MEISVGILGKELCGEQHLKRIIPNPGDLSHPEAGSNSKSSGCVLLVSLSYLHHSCLYSQGQEEDLSPSSSVMESGFQKFSSKKTHTGGKLVPQESWGIIRMEMHIGS